jgi:hypothetical protein
MALTREIKRYRKRLTLTAGSTIVKKSIGLARARALFFDPFKKTKLFFHSAIYRQNFPFPILVPVVIELFKAPIITLFIPFPIASCEPR